jgi:hypothetical protein
VLGKKRITLLPASFSSDVTAADLEASIAESLSEELNASLHDTIRYAQNQYGCSIDAQSDQALEWLLGEALPMLSRPIELDRSAEKWEFSLDLDNLMALIGRQYPRERTMASMANIMARIAHLIIWSGIDMDQFAAPPGSLDRRALDANGGKPRDMFGVCVRLCPLAAPLPAGCASARRLCRCLPAGQLPVGWTAALCTPSVPCESELIVPSTRVICAGNPHS